MSVIYADLCRVFDPFAQYSAENYPPVIEQEAFFHYALLEANHIDNPVKQRAGPFNQDFDEVLQKTHASLQEIGPHITPEYIMPMMYRSRDVREMLGKLPLEDRRDLDDIQIIRQLSIDRVAERISPLIATQTIAPGLLETPDYCHQGQDFQHIDSLRTCVNACFRMVFGGITGWAPYESVVAEQMIDKRGSVVVDDVEYHKIFKTDIFGEICAKQVTSIDLTGADFKTIGAIAEGVKSRIPHAQVFSTLSLGSMTAERSVWHAGVLLEVTPDSVVYHDPSARNGRAHRSIPKQTFLEHWAIAYNRAQIIIAA